MTCFKNAVYDNAKLRCEMFTFLARTSECFNKKKFSSRTNKPSSLTGFTLIELMCVIVIIALLFSLSSPLLSNTAKNLNFKSKTSQLKSICELLKKTSIFEKATYKLAIDISDNSYSILEKTDDADIFLLSNDSLLRKRTLPDTLYFLLTKQEKEEIIFNQDGTISAAVIVIKHKKGNTAKITTTLSGEIKLEYL